MLVRRFFATRYIMLAAATLVLMLNFWAWSLLSPLANSYAGRLQLTPFAISLLLAIPVVIGSLGRVPLGLLADRYGGHRVLVATCLIASLPVAALAYTNGYVPLLFVALCLGIAGASFAAGVPFVSAWFPKREQGLALGIYAIGNAGTAASGFLTPRLIQTFGQTTLFLVLAVWLIVAGALLIAQGKDAPGWRPISSPVRARLAAALRWRPAWQLAGLYAVTFGAFVSFGLYLPLLLHTSYGLATADAAARAGGFVLFATAARPLGGWLSDRIGGRVVIRGVFLIVALLALFLASAPALMPAGTIAYLLLASILGMGSGAVFAIIGRRCDSGLVGTVTGLVGAAGGIGGFFPPLILGLSFQLFHSYTVALLLLSALCVAVFVGIGVSSVLPRLRPQETHA